MQAEGRIQREEGHTRREAGHTRREEDHTRAGAGAEAAADRPALFPWRPAGEEEAEAAHRELPERARRRRC